jgi:hypothetical protein
VCPRLGINLVLHRTRKTVCPTGSRVLLDDVVDKLFGDVFLVGVNVVCDRQLAYKPGTNRNPRFTKQRSQLDKLSIGGDLAAVEVGMTEDRFGDRVSQVITGSMTS